MEDKKLENVPFKKSIFGVNPEQVAEYIATQEANLKHASEVFEEKIEEMKNNVALLSREKDSSSERIDSLNAQINQLKERCVELEGVIQENEQKQAGYDAIITENENLKTQVQEYKLQADKIADYEDQNFELKAQTEYYKKEYDALNEKVSEINAEHKAAIDELSSENRQLQEQISSKRINLAQSVKNHKYSIKKVADALASLESALADINETFDSIEKV